MACRRWRVERRGREGQREALVGDLVVVVVLVCGERESVVVAGELCTGSDAVVRVLRITGRGRRRRRGRRGRRVGSEGVGGVERPSGAGIVE